MKHSGAQAGLASCGPRIRDSASSAVSSAVGRLCRYRSVVTMLAWPRRSLTTCRSAPPARSQDACACASHAPAARRARPRHGPGTTPGGGTSRPECARPSPWFAARKGILTGRTASGPVVSVSTPAVLTAASRGVVGGEGPVPVPSAVGVRVGQACCLDDAGAMPGRSGPGLGS